MIGFQGVECHIDFDRLLEKTAEFAVSEPGVELILSSRPSSNEEEVKLSLLKTAQMADVIKAFDFPLETFPDVSGILRKLKKEGSVLSTLELIALYRLSKVSAKLKGFLGKLRETHPLIFAYSRHVYSFREFLKTIELSIDVLSGEVLDSASQNLSFIRKEKRELVRKIKERLTALINRNEDICPERIITQRDGRFVILARTSFKSRFSGIVHDRSSSGAMVYVEPSFIIEENNRLRALESAERQEVRKILKKLTETAFKFIRQLETAFSALSELDKLQAVARMSLKLGGTLPEFSDELFLIGARHPLLALSDRQVVPVDIKVKRGLVITGPNTGGKTVTLKTVGIICAMAQSGFLPPVEEGSSLKIFKRITADIGDEQSLEQNLSTFSAHVKNIAQILKTADPDTLVLLDELGAGTDPAEGANLGIAILEYLKKKRALCLVTTHFMPIKLYAYKDDYYEVASVMFDEKTLKPLYRLAYGIMGRSYALMIARKFGMPEEVIETARSLMGKESTAADGLLGALEREFRELERKRKEAERLKSQYTERLKELEAKEKQLEKEGIRKIEEFLRDFERKSKSILSSSSTKSQQARSLINSARAFIESFSQEEKDIEAGDEVEFINGKKGVVESVDRRKKLARVVFGGITVEVALSKLKKIGRASRKKTVEVFLPKPRSASTKLDLRGMRADEALAELESFLDRASRAGLKSVLVIHGQGEGILKKLVRQYLEGSPYVKGFRPGTLTEGGDGATVIFLL